MHNLPVLVDMELQPLIALATLERMRRDEVPEMLARMLAHPGGLANLLMNQFHLFTIAGNREFALEMLDQALQQQTIYRIASGRPPSIRLLALMGRGDTADNTPLDYLIEDSDIQLDLLYIQPDQPLPERIPDHDAVIVALGESARNNAALKHMEALLAHWPRPVLNSPSSILRCSRDAVCRQLQSLPGVAMPLTLRVSRAALHGLAQRTLTVSELLGAGDYPITVRPLDSQAGKGLSRIDAAAQLSAYLAASDAQEFYVSFYIDYRSADGMFRKSRIALIDRQPYICHHAISEQWIVHYQSAGMGGSVDKRAEEDAFMRDFYGGFALRHRAALGMIAARLALDYVVLDCAETSDGKLLVFEADNRAWVHATDPQDSYAYKQAHMRKVFAAFRDMLLKAKR